MKYKKPSQGKKEEWWEVEFHIQDDEIMIELRRLFLENVLKGGK